MVSSTFWGVTGFWDMTKSPPRGVLEYCQEEGDMMEEKGSKIRKCVQTEKACQNGSQSLALHEDHCLHISVFCLNVYNTTVAI